MSTEDSNNKQENAIDVSALAAAVPTSPAFVLDRGSIRQALAQLAVLRQQTGCKVLYSIKALPLSGLLHLVKPLIDGFSVSSLFEAQLAKEVLADQGSIHLTTPGLRPDEWPVVSSLISHVSFNSLGQHQRYFQTVPSGLSVGLRINPKLSFLQDDRFNPCRAHSKLGVALDEFCDHADLYGVKGLHFHTVFSATDFKPLQATVDKLRLHLNARFADLEWLNLGGGYLFDTADCRPFIELVQELTANKSLQVYIEPGKAIVGQAGYLLATVLDVFISDGKTIAVLDTSVNHHPEVFEYQRQPTLHEQDDNGAYSVILAGCTCLAGDLFGEYRLQKPLKVGDKVTFKYLGAYSLIKANRFNGYNLPDIYWHDQGQLTRIKHYSYQAYRDQWLST